MSAEQMQQERHNVERGYLLRCLADDFGREFTSTRLLYGAMDKIGFPMSPAGMQFSLGYLAEQGYIAITRAKETPGWRADRANAERADAIVWARLTAKGLQLIDGIGAADPLVQF